MKKMISFQYLFIMGCSFLSLWSCTDHKKVTFETAEDGLIKHSARFYKPPLSAIKPTGWLHHYLTTQKNGITGHLDAAGGYPFNLPTWSDTAKVVDDRAQSTWWPFEQTGYWIEGMIRTGRLLEDEDLIRKARKYLNYPLDNPSKDGFIGPSFLKEEGKTNRWAHVVYFRALMTEYEATGNQKIVDAIYNHLKYDLDTYPYRHVREMGIIESMLWAYEHTRDERLLKRAEDIFVEGNKINTSRSSSAHQILDQNRPINEHGVTFLEFARLGAILYMYTGKSKYLELTQAAYRKVEKQALLVDGVNSSTELLKGKDPLNSHETCDIVEVAYGWCKMLQATGDPTYADKIEKAAFNAGPGAVTADYKAMQYFSCPNQVIAGNSSNHNDYMKGNSSMQFAPSAWIKCCPGQVSRSMPLYASQFWYVKENHIFTGTYGPNTFSVTTRSGETFQIDEKTNYPFEESILLKIKTKKDIQFALNLRIPGWCSEATVELNGHRVITSDFGGQYVRLDTLFKNGDEVVLHLPMRVIMSKWPRNTGAIEYGPLVFSLGIEEKRQIDASSEWSASTDFPALNLSPTSNWNYAFAFRQDNFQDVITVSRTSGEVGQWSMDKSPISIKVPVRKIKNWEVERQEKVLQEDYWPTHKADTVAYWNKEFVKLEGEFALTPNIPTRNFLIENVSQTIDTIRLVPYGFTNLRMTIFPLSPID